MRGLTARLDYLQSLGITALWLLPFFPSPLRDDGYDIADYTSVHPAYGTLEDIEELIAQAHERDIRVIAELVVNHTSDQHPWFQRARRAPKGSPERDWYVWSDDDKSYQGTRIIFTDTEFSNWAWDPVAQQYFWHRFFSHQPDLNFDNPEVLGAIVDVMRFWSERGIDGFRLDAVPYLCEREGTNNENLPETHAVIKILRAVLEKEFPDRIFLAEANQWPEDLNAYFGDGDECHMCFHFPLMPRMFMAVADGDRYPIYDILRQTPPIPDGAQWAVFLRNHDELTLEMVSDRERERMNAVYAVEPKMRINVGIRRRLAPLLENDRRRIELMNGLLLSMPGTPVLYYGDEIGMGDNLFLKDRDGVRTPMQWSPDRNGGFSTTEPVRLYAPPVTDPTYGYLAVNVEMQERSSSSLLNWMRRIIAVRRATQIFGRGTLTMLYPSNRRVAAYLREYDGDTILVVANLAATAEPVSLDLSAFSGRTPFEMLGSTAFPPIGAAPYQMTLAPHGFFWFSLVRDTAAVASAGSSRARVLPELPTIVVRPSGIAFDRWARAVLAADIVPLALGAGERAEVRDAFVPGEFEPNLAYLIVGTGDHVSSLPLRFVWDAPLREDAIARARSGSREGWIVDGASDGETALAVERAMHVNEILHDGGTLTFAFEADAPPEGSTAQRLGASSGAKRWIVDDERLVTLYRAMPKLEDSSVAVLRHLARVGYTRIARLLGTALAVAADGTSRVLATSQQYVAHQADLEQSLRDLLRSRTVDERLVPNAEAVADGLAALHYALAAESEDTTFAPQPLHPDDLRAWREDAQREFDLLVNDGTPGTADLRERVARAIAKLPAHIDASGGRAHGRLTLKRVLMVDGQATFVGFGERAEDRSSPLKDVASITRSFELLGRDTIAGAEHDVTADAAQTADVTETVTSRAHSAFLKRYAERTQDLATVPRDAEQRDALLHFFRLRGALRDVSDAAARHPELLAAAVAALEYEC